MSIKNCLLSVKGENMVAARQKIKTTEKNVIHKKNGTDNPNLNITVCFTERLGPGFPSIISKSF